MQYMTGPIYMEGRENPEAGKDAKENRSVKRAFSENVNAGRTGEIWDMDMRERFRRHLVEEEKSSATVEKFLPVCEGAAGSQAGSDERTGDLLERGAGPQQYPARHEKTVLGSTGGGKQSISTQSQASLCLYLLSQEERHRPSGGSSRTFQHQHDPHLHTGKRERRISSVIAAGIGTIAGGT